MTSLNTFFRTKNTAEIQTKLDSFAMGMFLAVMGAGTLLAAWLLVQDATKRAVITDIADATRQGNIHALNEKTDWTSVRNWLKQDLKQRAAAEQSAKVDQIVDYYVRPENLPSLLYYYNTSANHVKPEAFVRDARFSGITQITVEFAAPPQFDKPWLEKLKPVRAVFELDGLDWKLKRIDAPDYLIPTAAPATIASKEGA
jgi:hypothetical protein